MKKLSSTQLLVFIGLGLFVLALVFPQTFWGFNYHAFLPKPILALLSVFVAFFAYRALKFKTEQEQIFHKRISNLQYVIGLVLAALFISQFLPMAIDVYGDSRSISGKFERIFNGDKSWFDAISKVLSLNIFDLHSGEKFTFNLAYLVKQIFSTSYEKSFYIVNSVFAVTGALFYALLTLKLNNLAKGISALLFFSGNYILATRGHLEVYGASFGFSFMYAYLVKNHFEKNSWNSFGLLLIGGIFLMKSHINHVIVIAPMLFMLGLTLSPKFLERLTFKNVLILIGSGSIGFILAYFLVFENHSSNYAVREKEELLSNVFLPLFGSEVPYDNYGLLNFNHFLDWFSLIIMWSPVAMPIVFITVFKNKEQFIRNHFALILMFLVITYALVAFAINPLLSMPRDWDLLSLGAPFVVVLSAIVLNHSRAQKLMIYKVAFLVSAFVIPRIAVESSKQLSSNRLLAIGAHVHNTYYAGSSVILSSAIKSQQNPDYEYIKDYSLKLSYNSKVYPDNELCHFFTQSAYWLADEKNKKVLALDFFRLALEQNNEYEIALKGAIVILQNQNRVSESLPLVESILVLQPNVKEYHQMLLNCYISLKMKKELQIAVNNYLELFPEDRELIRSKIGI
ncbi:MAG: hypothetical protein JXQ87_07345 [Bacteroidia bacterium]